MREKHTHIPTYLGTWCQEYLLSDIEYYVLHGRALDIPHARADYEDAKSITNVLMRCCEAGEEVEAMN